MSCGRDGRLIQIGVFYYGMVKMGVNKRLGILKALGLKSEGLKKGPVYREPDAKLWDQIDNLRDLMCVDVIEGETRQTASVTLFVEEGVLKACIHAREEELSLFVSIRERDVLAALDDAVSKSDADWRRKETRGRKRGS